MDLRPIGCQFHNLCRAKPFDLAKHGVVAEHGHLKSIFVKALAIESDARQGCSRCEKRCRKQVQFAVMINRKTRKIITEDECPTALMQHGSKLTGEL
jgi:CO dehydrogenase/acetyl-CoA synthase alpha subunit